jgi:hypothetical protein
MKSILDPSFRYVPSTATDVRKTFARVRREMQKSGRAGARDVAADAPHVFLFSRAKEAAGGR